MLRYPWRIGLAWGLFIFVFVAALATTAIQQDARVPQAPPYTVYQSGLYCVYITSNQAGIAMQVVANPTATIAMLGGKLDPCE